MTEQKDDTTAAQVSNRRSWRRRLNWALLVLFTYLALECAVIGLAMGGAWLVLLAPAVVCSYKAVETWQALMGRKAHRAKQRVTTTDIASAEPAARS